MARVGQERATGIELYDRGNSRVEERKAGDHAKEVDGQVDWGHCGRAQLQLS